MFLVQPFVRFGSDIWDWLLRVPCPITQTLTSTVRFVPGVLDKFCYFSISPFKAIHTISHGLPLLIFSFVWMFTDTSLCYTYWYT